MAMGNGVSRASFDAVPTEDAARIVDIVDACVAVAGRDSPRFCIVRGFNVDTASRTGGRTKKASDAFL